MSSYPLGRQGCLESIKKIPNPLAKDVNFYIQTKTPVNISLNIYKVDLSGYLMGNNIRIGANDTRMSGPYYCRTDDIFVAYGYNMDSQQWSCLGSFTVDRDYPETNPLDISAFEFVKNFISTWTKVMNLDRFDLK